MEDFIRPILQEALAKKTKSAETRAEEAVEESETLLEHLVKLTDGKCACITVRSGDLQS